MLTVGLTGGIGSGKSIVCEIFKQLKVPVYNADIEAKRLMINDSSLRELLIKGFGNDIYLNPTSINKAKLASIIFNDREALKRINSIVHPAVYNDFQLWLTKIENSNYAIIEAAILLESQAFKALDKVITIYAPMDIRIKRVMKRDKTDKASVFERILNQLNEQEKIEKADYVIYNDDKQMVIPQVLKIHNLLKEEL